MPRGPTQSIDPITPAGNAAFDRMTAQGEGARNRAASIQQQSMQNQVAVRGQNVQRDMAQMQGENAMDIAAMRGQTARDVQGMQGEQYKDYQNHLLSMQDERIQAQERAAKVIMEREDAKQERLSEFIRNYGKKTPGAKKAIKEAKKELRDSHEKYLKAKILTEHKKPQLEAMSKKMDELAKQQSAQEGIYAPIMQEAWHRFVKRATTGEDSATRGHKSPAEKFGAKEGLLRKTKPEKMLDFKPTAPGRFNIGPDNPKELYQLWQKLIPGGGSGQMYKETVTEAETHYMNSNFLASNIADSLTESMGRWQPHRFKSNKGEVTDNFRKLFFHLTMSAGNDVDRDKLDTAYTDEVVNAMGAKNAREGISSSYRALQDAKITPDEIAAAISGGEKIVGDLPGNRTWAEQLAYYNGDVKKASKDLHEDFRITKEAYRGIELDSLFRAADQWPALFELAGGYIPDPKVQQEVVRFIKRQIAAGDLEPDIMSAFEGMEGEEGARMFDEATQKVGPYSTQRPMDEFEALMGVSDATNKLSDMQQEQSESLPLQILVEMLNK